MKRFNSIYIALLAICFSVTALAQSTDPDPSNNVPCPNESFPCCETWNACNGPYYGSWSYDPDFASTGFCDLACTPIDSGVLFLLLGGAAFGGMMIMRRRQQTLEVIKH